MKNLPKLLLTLIVLCFSTLMSIAKAIDYPTKYVSLLLKGAWITNFSNEEKEITEEVTFIDGYYSIAGYNVVSKEFYYTKGGSYILDGNKLILTWEFDTQNKEQVGKQGSFTIKFKGNTLSFDDKTWERIDNGTPEELAGAWLITGRKRDGEISRSTPGARKTMKILSGTRFQWIAYNTATGEFFGTGGGSYTTIDGKYTENIEFFSRDASKVGVSLPFDYSIQDKEWHHSGLSSKGQPMYEIWTPRSMLE